MWQSELLWWCGLIDLTAREDQHWSLVGGSAMVDWQRFAARRDSLPAVLEWC